MTPRAAVELFHLVFLRALFAPAEDRPRFALKGGCNLRFFFGSVRYSEDIDLDAAGVAPHTLGRKVERLLSAPVVVSPLRSRDLEIVEVTAPKQTDTTQRWKLGLRAKRAAPLRTKVEFSRRGPIEGSLFEAVDDAVVRPQALPRFLAMHYGLERAIVQKIGALADRTVTQARDVFDLHVLFARLGAGRVRLTATERKRLPRAIENAMGIGFDEFSGHVLAFLDPEQSEPYATREAWNGVQSSVVGELERL